MKLETKLRLINEVTNELKDMLTIPEGLQIEDCHATAYLGMAYVKENKITISTYIKTTQDYKNVLAHELIHFNCEGHGKVFKEYCKKINELGLGYDIQTTAKNVSNLKEIREARVKKRNSKKSYLVYCPHCGWNRMYKIKRKDISRYRCPKCWTKLKQKQYKEGGINEFRFNA